MARKTSPLMALAAVAVIIGVAGLMLFLFGAQIGVPTGAAGTEPTIIVGDQSATAILRSYDLAADSRTAVTATVSVIDSEGGILLNDASVGNVSVNKGDSVDVYGTGTTYYCDPILGLEITKNNQYIDMDCYTGAAEGSMTLKVYDDTNTELTADDNGSNEADYALSLGVDEIEVLYLRGENRDSDSVYWLGGICSFSGGNIDDAEINDGDFSEMSMPEEVDDATWAIANDSGTDQTGDWNHCYKPSGKNYIVLEEYQNTGFIQALVSAGGTEPEQNHGDNFGFLIVDFSYNIGADGTIFAGIHDGSADEDTGNMGVMDEGTKLTDAFGLDIVAAVDAN